MSLCLGPRDVESVLNTVAMVGLDHETQFCRNHRTKVLILAYMNAPAAGDTEAPLAV